MGSLSGIRPLQGSEAVASGTLAGVSLAYALVYIRNKRLSGVLELRASASRSAWLVLGRGRAVSCITAPVMARFGPVAYEMGLVDAETLDRATLDASRSLRPQMEIMLEQELLTERERDAVLAEQICRRVHHLFSYPAFTTFAFRAGAPSGVLPRVTTDVLAPVWRGLREMPLDARVSEVLARLGDHPLRLTSDAALEHAELAAEERALCETLARQSLSLGQLRQASPLPQERVDRLAHFLVLTRSVEASGAERHALPSQSMWPAAQATDSVGRDASPRWDGDRSSGAPSVTTTAAIRGPADLGADELRHRAAHLASETPFATLGLAEGASAEAARAAFFRLGRLWNPDRVPPALVAMRPEIERIYAHMTQAHRTLTDPAARPAVVAHRR